MTNSVLNSRHELYYAIIGTTILILILVGFIMFLLFYVRKSYLKGKKDAAATINASLEQASEVQKIVPALLDQIKFNDDSRSLMIEATHEIEKVAENNAVYALLKLKNLGSGELLSLNSEDKMRLWFRGIMKHNA